jgi:hypothetical protein
MAKQRFLKCRHEVLGRFYDALFLSNASFLYGEAVYINPSVHMKKYGNGEI